MKNHLNLIPDALGRSQIVRRCLWRWSLLSFIVIAAAGTYIYQARWIPYCHQRVELEARQRRLSRLNQLSDEIETMRARRQQLVEEVAALSQLGHEASEIILLGIVGRAARQSGNAVVVDQWTLDCAEAGTSSASGSSILGKMTLQGRALNHTAVARFVGALREVDTFCSVQLKSTQFHTEESGRRGSYVVECVF